MLTPVGRDPFRLEIVNVPDTSLELPMRKVPRRVVRWLEAGTPGAVVRFGEGEGRILSAAPDDELSMKVAVRKVRRQTGLTLSDADVMAIRTDVMRAFDEADVLGIRGSDSFSEEHLMWVERLEALYDERTADGRPPAIVTHCLVNNALRDALPRLLRGQPRVTIVTCRDLEETFRAKYGVRDVNVVQIPSQYIMREVDSDWERRLHHVPIWPDYYEEVRARLEPREPGELFLIGAGLFGKGLCIDVKHRGGIALDLGSTLDRLAGKVTRGPGRPKPYRPPA
jgi:hypothetical protein